MFENFISSGVDAIGVLEATDVFQSGCDVAFFVSDRTYHVLDVFAGVFLCLSVIVRRRVTLSVSVQQSSA